MNLYDALAPVYDGFFPQNPRATSYFLGLLPKEGPSRRLRALDLGSATGSQVLDLAAKGIEAIGLEPSEAMLRMAASKAAGIDSARFQAGSMLDAKKLFGARSLDLILCLGNTLPHLGGEAELRGLLADLAGLLVPGGSLVLQLINYERILELEGGAGFAFPVLESEGYRFKRRYRPSEGEGLVFETSLLSPEGRESEGASLLYPVRASLLLSLLSISGFESPEIRGGWDKEDFSPNSDNYLIITAKAKA